jgi:DNA-binding response OmpR family regulator
MAKRILIVDDTPIILEAARHALVEAGFDVDTRNGVIDLAERGATGFDLILMDVNMPELCGDDVASILRHERAIATPIYLFSTLTAVELEERAHEAGLDGFISKTHGLDHLVQQVRRILFR